LVVKSLIRKSGEETWQKSAVTGFVSPHEWAILGLPGADYGGFCGLFSTTHNNIRIKCGWNATFPQNAGIR
jgi:hypothetical protein